jgi:hypothetical protein
MKEYAVIIGAVVLVAIGGLWAVNARVVPTPIGGGKACTMEAKLCPDGSAVGRTGPNCEFAECPTAATTTSGGNGGGSILPYKSGVRGTVSLGPTCPVQRIPPDPQCADRGYATTVVVHHTGSSSTFATGKSDVNGAFEFSLPPGTYTLTAGSGTMLPRCNPTEVTVGASGYATTTISCDTGIR